MMKKPQLCAIFKTQVYVTDRKQLAESQEENQQVRQTANRTANVPIHQTKEAPRRRNSGDKEVHLQKKMTALISYLPNWQLPGETDWTVPWGLRRLSQQDVDLCKHGPRASEQLSQAVVTVLESDRTLDPPGH